MQEEYLSRREKPKTVKSNQQWSHLNSCSNKDHYAIECPSNKSNTVNDVERTYDQGQESRDVQEKKVFVGKIQGKMNSSEVMNKDDEKDAKWTLDSSADSHVNQTSIFCLTI